MTDGTMKTIGILLLTSLLFACNIKQHENLITVKGCIENSDMDEITISFDSVLYYAKPDSSGVFNLKFTQSRPRVYTLNNNHQLFLIPGDSLIVNQCQGDLIFSGGQSAILSNYWKEQRGSIRDQINKKEYFDQSPTDFVKSVYAYMDSSMMQLEKFQKCITTGINQEFLRLEKERIKYFWLKDILEYEKTYKNYTLKEINVDSEYYEKIKEDVELNNSDLLQLNDYKDFLFSYAFAVSKKLIQESTEKPNDKYSETNKIINYISNEFKDGKVFDYVIFRIIKDRTIKLQVDSANLKRFKHLCTNNEYVAEVENKYVEFESIMTGIPAPDFTFYDIQNRAYNLNSFKGKFLVIDVWTPYCGSCIREMPYLHKIDNEFSDEEIAFITVCLHKNPDLWQKRIRDLNLKGLQLIDKDGWNSHFREATKIPWFPIFMFIDKEGKFIDARAPRPSEGLRELINTTINTNT